MNYILSIGEAIESGKVVTSRASVPFTSASPGKSASPDPASPYYFDEDVGERPILFAERFCSSLKGVIGAPQTRAFSKGLYSTPFSGFLEGKQGFRRYRETMFLWAVKTANRPPRRDCALIC